MPEPRVLILTGLGLNCEAETAAALNGTQLRITVC